MPNIKSAEKRMRQSMKRRAENRAVKSRVRTYTKKVLTAVDEGNLGDAQARMSELQEVVDKAAKSKTIHRNKAARRKSRMQKRINALQAAEKKD